MTRRFQPSFPAGWLAIALLLMRVVAGVAFMHHGWPKIQHAMSWMGPQAPVPAVFQLLAATAEFFGGLGLIVGCLTWIAAFGIMINMLVAIFMVHLPAGDPFVDGPGQHSWEIAAVYLSIMVLLQLAGPGRLSIDWLLFEKLRSRNS